MGGSGPHWSQKGPRFVLFTLDTNEERIPFSYSQLKISYSRLAVREPHFCVAYTKCNLHLVIIRDIYSFIYLHTRAKSLSHDSRRRLGSS